MKSYDYNAVYYHDYCYCLTCLPQSAQDSQAIYPIFASDEADYYPSCVVCGLEHTYTNLTEEGHEREHKYHTNQSASPYCPLCYAELRDN